MSESKGLVIATNIMAVAACVAAGVAIWAVRQQHEDARELLQAQISAELDKEFDSTEMRRARKLFASELIKNRRKLPAEDRVLGFFEKLGAYQRLGRIDGESTFSSFSDVGELYWAASADAIRGLREETKIKDYYSDFEALDNRLLKQESRERHQPQSKVVPTPAEVQDFLRDESRASIPNCDS